MFCELWQDDGGQDVAEYALMLAILLVMVVPVIRAIGTSADHVFSKVGSQMGNVSGT